MAHGVGCCEPSEHALPGGQSWHSNCAVKPLSLPNVPASQFVSVAAPASQKPPKPHASQAVAPSASWYLPATQAEHESELALGAMAPAGQGEGAVEPVSYTHLTLPTILLV